MVARARARAPRRPSRRGSSSCTSRTPDARNAASASRTCSGRTARFAPARDRDLVLPRRLVDRDQRHARCARRPAPRRRSGRLRPRAARRAGCPRRDPRRPARSCARARPAALPRSPGSGPCRPRPPRARSRAASRPAARSAARARRRRRSGSPPRRCRARVFGRRAPPGKGRRLDRAQRRCEWLSTLPSSRSRCPSRSTRPSTTRCSTANARSRARACSCRTAGAGWSGSWSRTRPARRRARAGRCARVLQVLDDEPVLPAALLEVVLRAARDALCPPGIALAAAVPPGTAPRPGTRVALLPAGMRALERGELRGTLGERAVGARQARALREPSCARAFPRRCQRSARLERLGLVSRSAATDPPRVRARTERVYRRRAGARPRGRGAIARARAAPARAPAGARLRPRRPRVRAAALRALVEAGFVLCEERELVRFDPRRSAGRAEPPRPSSPRTRGQRSAEIATAIEARPLRAVPALRDHRQRQDRGLPARGRARARARDAARSCSCPRSRSPTSSSTASARASASGSRCCTAGSRRGERFDQWRLHPRGPRADRDRRALGGLRALHRSGSDRRSTRSTTRAYKSDEGFRYHARDVARLRAERAGCPLVLGSATPDVGTAWRSAHGELAAADPAGARGEPAAADGGDRRPGERERARGATPQHALAAAAPGAGRDARGRPAGDPVPEPARLRGATCTASPAASRCAANTATSRSSTTRATGRAGCDDPLEGELRCHYCGYREDPKSTLPERATAPKAACRASAPSASLEEVVATLPGRARRPARPRHLGTQGRAARHPGRLPPRRARRPGRHADGREGPRRPRT